MATYQEIYNLRTNNLTLQAKVTVACVKAAQNVLNEDPGTQDHAQRVLWASAALNDPGAMANRMMWGLLGNATIQTNGDASTDGDVQYVIDGLIPTYMNGV